MTCDHHRLPYSNPGSPGHIAEQRVHSVRVLVMILVSVVRAFPLEIEYVSILTLYGDTNKLYTYMINLWHIGGPTLVPTKGTCGASAITSFPFCP